MCVGAGGGAEKREGGGAGTSTGQTDALSSDAILGKMT